MLEEGTVVRIEGDGKALVELERKSACGACCARQTEGGQACSLSSAGGKMQIEADNQVSAKTGDRVRLDIEAKGLVAGAAMLYLLPALGLIFGIVLGERISSNAGVLFGIILMFLFFIIGRFYSGRKVSYTAHILDKIA